MEIWYNVCIKQEANIILWDIETARLRASVFNRKTEYIKTEDIEDDTFIICGSWKKLGHHRVFSVSTLDDPKRLKKNPRDDYHVVKTLRDVLSKADILIAHNGNRFDLPMLNQRIITHGLEPLPTIRSIDTLKEAKKSGMFTSMSLDWLSHIFGFDGKSQTNKGMWKGAEKGDVGSIRKMVRYNKNDVIQLEQVYERLRKYIKNKPSVFFEKRPDCAYCKTGSTQKRGTRIRASGLIVQEYVCTSCGKRSHEVIHSPV